MITTGVLSRYNMGIRRFYEWRYQTGFQYRILLAFIFACFTGLGAQIRIYTPFTPVPFTGQVFFVLLSGLMLGSMYGGLSQMIYLSLGFAGIPWFAGGNNGFEYVFGATGGYLVGFIFASMLIGWYSDRYTRARTLRGMFPLMMAGILIIYTFGIIWLAIVLQISLFDAIIFGGLPFITLDILKAILAVGVGKLVTTREPIYHGIEKLV